MRRRQLKKLWARLKELQQMAPARDTLLLKLGAAKSQYPSGWRLGKVEVSQDGELSFNLSKDKLREIRQREGRYLLRSNLGSENPAQLWQLYVLLTQIEEAFKNLKGDLALRPIFHPGGVQQPGRSLKHRCRHGWSPSCSIGKRRRWGLMPKNARSVNNSRTWS